MTERGSVYRTLWLGKPQAMDNVHGTSHD